jgi:hypothetical protein
MTSKEFKTHVEDIKKMSQEECARLHRFAPIGHIYFSDHDLYFEFQKHFQVMGGMTPEISKKIGWRS